MDTDSKDRRWLLYTRSHLETMIEHGVDRSGEHPSLMWYANMDSRERHHLPPIAGGEAPGGSSLYWDQPLLVAAHTLAELIGQETFARAADEYVRGFTERCLARSGLLLWGPHYYFDTSAHQTMRVGEDGKATPCDPETEMGDRHNTCPIPPAWELLWRINPAITEEAILGAAQCQITDPTTGAFNHAATLADGGAYLGAGGILIEGLGWLVRKVEGDFPMLLARTVANYSFAARNRSTGLLPLNPAAGGWERTTATGAVGLWAGCLIRAAALADEPEWIGLADEALSAWLKRAHDVGAGTFHSHIDIATGKPTHESTPLDVWSTAAGMTGHTLQIAEACYLLYGETEDAEYAAACRAWRDQIAATLPAGGGSGTSAGNYGRAIHFLKACSEEWPEEGYDELARQVADEAMKTLWTGKMFRSSPGSDACRSSDGIGYLLLALLYLHTERDPHMMGSGW